ncbi:Asp-tRNA(Asn)/Glu-tRNA(Gln) amidotransferase A subunit family amidase [Bradyrhizobium sp. LM2.7]
MDFDQLTLTQAAADLRAGIVTSKALTTEALARAKADADLNAFVTLDEAGALKAAAAFDANGDRDKPLGDRADGSAGRQRDRDRDAAAR